jgi:hypothetical protein
MKSIKLQLFDNDEKLKSYKLTEGEYTIGSGYDTQIRIKDK